MAIEKTSTVPTTGKQLLDKVHSIKGDSEKDILASRNRVMIASGVAGSMFGIYYGYSRNKNIVVMGLLGGVICALIGRAMMPK